MSKELLSFNQVRIDGAALQHNYRLIRNLLPEQTRLLAMVKADGYGHDMVFAAKAFAAAGCRAFGVAELCEGVRLRQSGVRGLVLIMVGFLPGQADYFLQHELTAVVSDFSAVEELSAAAVRQKKKQEIHIKIDGGMHRLGLTPDALPAFYQAVRQLPGITVGGLLSHFPEADQPEKASNAQLLKLFANANAAIEADFSGIRHIANSGAVLTLPQAHCDLARSGIALYGYLPDGSNEHPALHGEQLQPAMQFISQVIQVKEVPAGAGISYGHIFFTKRPSRLAVLPVGYEDGYLRVLSNHAEVLIGGQRAPIVGRVCMNLCMADVTDIASVQAGDEAVLLGGQGDDSITANELARRAGTISYEILCLIGNNNQRLLLN